MKHCVNCKWCAQSGGKPEFWRCLHPDIAVEVVSPVDGVASVPPRYCAIERNYAPSKCGPDGRLWEAAQ